MILGPVRVMGTGLVVTMYAIEVAIAKCAHCKQCSVYTTLNGLLYDTVGC